MKLVKLAPIFVILPLFILTGCASNKSEASYGQAQQSFATQDYQTAFKQVQTSANNGSAEAEYALGYMYYYGKGTEANQALGKKWIARSAAQGYDTALQAYQMILAQEQSGATLTQATSTIPTETPTPVVSTTVIPTPTVTPSASTVMAAAPATPVVVVKKPISANHYTLDEKAILAMPANHYAIQLADTGTANAAQALIEQHHLTHTAYYYRRNLNGTQVYVVIMGNYSTQAAAVAAVKKLPKALQRSQPWPRRYAEIQAQLREIA